MGLFFVSAFGAFGSSVLGAWATQHFLHSRIPLLGSFIGLQPSFNEGIAFGITLPFQSLVILFVLIAVTIMGVQSSNALFRKVGFGLIVGGGWANVVDRMVDGTVTDIFQVGSFPIFNVADSCITVGVVILLLDWLQHRKDIDPKVHEKGRIWE